jgi:hypothetical protein
VLNLKTSQSAADRIHRRFLDEGLPERLSSRAFAAFECGGYSPELLQAGRESWQRRALDEHSSLVTFTELLWHATRMQMPFDVVGSCVRVVRDQARHVELCRRMVAALGGGTAIPGEQAPGSIAEPPLAQWVVRTVFGSLCLERTFSARCLAATCGLTTDALARAAVKCLLSDQSIHSLLGWTILELLWSALEDDDRHDIVRTAVTVLGQCDRLVRDAETQSQLAHPFGYLPPDALQSVYLRTRREFELRLARFGIVVPEAPALVDKPSRIHGRLAPRLEVCRRCSRHVEPSTRACPHCGADVPEAARQYYERVVQMEEALAEARELLSKLP